MKLKKQFKNFYNEITIDNEIEDLIEKRTILENNFKNNFPVVCKDNNIELNKSDIRIFDQGSYKLHTTIKNTYGSIDRDVAVMFPLDICVNNDSRKIKKYGKEALTTNVRKPEIKEPCINVSYKENGEEWLHIDLPIYAQYDGKVYLARGKEFSENYLWEEADPDGLNGYLLEKITGNEQLRRIIRYIKKWKLEKYHSSTQSHEVPPSIGLTLLACDCFVQYSDSDGEDDLTSLFKTFQNIKNKFSLVYDVNYKVIKADITRELPIAPNTDVFAKMKNSDAYGVTFYNRFSTALQNLENACNVESEHDAGNYLRKVFGEEFEVPVKEAASVNTINQREHGFGSY